MHFRQDLIPLGHLLVFLGDECPMLAGPVFLFHGAGGGKDIPHDEISGGELMGRLRLLRIQGGKGLMIGWYFGFANAALLHVLPFAS